MTYFPDGHLLNLVMCLPSTQAAVFHFAGCWVVSFERGPAPSSSSFAAPWGLSTLKAQSNSLTAAQAASARWRQVARHFQYKSWCSQTLLVFDRFEAELGIMTSLFQNESAVGPWLYHTAMKSLKHAINLYETYGSTLFLCAKLAGRNCAFLLVNL